MVKVLEEVYIMYDFDHQFGLNINLQKAKLHEMSLSYYWKGAQVLPVIVRLVETVIVRLVENGTLGQVLVSSRISHS